MAQKASKVQTSAITYAVYPARACKAQGDPRDTLILNREAVSCLCAWTTLEAFV